MASSPRLSRILSSKPGVSSHFKRTQMARMKKAFGISNDFVEGESIDFALQEQRRQERKTAREEKDRQRELDARRREKEERRRLLLASPREARRQAIFLEAAAVAIRAARR